MAEEITLTDVSKSVEGINKAFEAFKEKNDERMKEMEKKGSSDVLLEDSLKKMNEEMDKQQATLDQFIARQKRQAQYETGNGAESPEELDAKAFQWAQINAKSRGTRVDEYTHENLQEYRKAFLEYVRKDDKVLSGEQQKALSVGVDPDGGYVVHPDMSGRIVGRVFETSPVRQNANVQTISTSELEGLHDIDEVGSGWVGETDGRPTTDTPELKKWRIPVHEQYAKPIATQKILDDAAIDMESWLANKIADKLARVENAAFVTGDGVGKPRGFLTYADWTSPGVYQLNAIERFATGANGAFAAAPNGADVLIDVVYGIQAEYRARSQWYMNRGTTGAARKLKDSDGAYLWQPGMAAGQPSTILGYSVASYEDMPAMATDSLSIAFGDMNSAYQIVDRMGIRVLRDPYSNKPYIEFYTTKRVGGDMTDFNALKLVEFTS